MIIGRAHDAGCRTSEARVSIHKPDSPEGRFRLAQDDPPGDHAGRS